MTIDLVEVIGLAHNFDFLGDNLNYRNRQIYSARARIESDYSQEETSYIWDGMGVITGNITGYALPVILNSVNIGTGQINSLSFSEGVDVRFKTYDIEFEILKTGNLYNATGQYYSGISGDLRYFAGLSESSDYSNNGGKIDYRRTISFDLDAGYTGNYFTGAKTFISGLFSRLVDLDIYAPVSDSFFPQNGNKYYNETIDLINGRFSCSEQYSYQTGQTYTWDYTHSLTRNDNGSADVTENGVIKSSRLDSATGIINYANSGWNVVKTGVYDRLNNFYTGYSPFISTVGTDIFDFPKSTSIARDPYAGSLAYSYAYTNDPTQQSGYVFDRAFSVSRDQAGFINVSENGSLKYLGVYETGRFESLYSSWEAAEAEIVGRVEGAYDANFSLFRSCGPLYYKGVQLRKTKEEVSYSERNAEIGYNYDFSEDPNYIGTGLFSFAKVSQTDNAPVHYHNYFNIVNYREVPQSARQSTLGNFSNQVEIYGRTGGIPLLNYLSAAEALVGLPEGSGITLMEKSYSFSPLTNAFSMNADYVYNYYRNATGILV